MSQIISESIPTSFTASVDRPFEMEGVRWAHENEMKMSRGNERLSQEQLKELIENPQITESTRLERLTKQANKEFAQSLQEEKIYNMSLKDLTFRTSDTIHNVIDDLVEFNSDDGVRGFIHIFTKSDRLIYVGIIVIVLTILLLLIKTTDT